MSKKQPLKARWVPLILCITLLSTSLACSLSNLETAVNFITRQEKRIQAIAIDPLSPSTLYAGTPRGVYKSADGAGTWSTASSGLTVSDVVSLAVDPQSPLTIYAGTIGPSGIDRGGLFVSTDGGSTWTISSKGMADNNITALVLDPTSPDTLYAGTGFSVYKSSDRGATWQRICGEVEGDVDALAIDPLNPTTLYVGTGFGVYKSTDSGNHCRKITLWIMGEGISDLIIDPLQSTTLYAAWRGGDGVQKSLDGGETWKTANTGLNAYVYTLAIDPHTPTTLYAGTADGVYKTTDGGQTWSAVNSGLTNLTVLCLAIDPVTPDNLYAGTKKGLYKSSNGGITWSSASSGLLKS